MATTERSIEEMLEDTEDTENNVEIEHIEEIQEPIQEIETKSIQRPKRERTQKQKDALEKAKVKLWVVSRLGLKSSKAWQRV